MARHLSRELSARGDVPVALIRSLDQVDDVVADGAEAVVLDLERCNVEDVANAIRGADAVVFAAGAGPGSGAPRKDSVDRAAAALLADAAESAGVRRYVLVSSKNVDREPPPGTDEVFAAYLRAKAASERDLRARDLDWTILRPGRLTDDPPTGHVRLDEVLDDDAPRAGDTARAGVGARAGDEPRDTSSGEVPRADVAAVVVALLTTPTTSGRTLELVAGPLPIAATIAAATDPAD